MPRGDSQRPHSASTMRATLATVSKQKSACKTCLQCTAPPMNLQIREMEAAMLQCGYPPSYRYCLPSNVKGTLFLNLLTVHNARVNSQENNHRNYLESRRGRESSGRGQSDRYRTPQFYFAYGRTVLWCNVLQPVHLRQTVLATLWPYYGGIVERFWCVQYCMFKITPFASEIADSLAPRIVWERYT